MSNSKKKRGEAKGRNETGTWWRRHDEYESLAQNAASCCQAAEAHA